MCKKLIWRICWIVGLKYHFQSIFYHKRRRGLNIMANFINILYFFDLVPKRNISYSYKIKWDGPNYLFERTKNGRLWGLFKHVQLFLMLQIYEHNRHLKSLDFEVDGISVYFYLQISATSLMQLAKIQKSFWDENYFLRQ